MGGSRCVVCRKTGPRGNFSFPPLTSKPFLLQKWLESLGIDQVPSSTNTRVCYRHFSPDKILQTNSTSATAKAFKLVKDAVPVRDIITVNPPWLEDNTVQQQGPYPCPATYEKAINLIATQCDKIKSLEETIEKIQTYLKDTTEAKAESQKEIENLRAENFNNTAELARVRKELLKLKESNNSPVVKKQPTKAEKKKIIWEFLSTFFTSAHQNEGDQKLYFHLCKGQNGVFVSTEMTLPDSINAVFIPKTAEDKVDVKEEMECEDDPLEVDRTELVAEENTSMSSIPSENVVIKQEPLEMSKN